MELKNDSTDYAYQTAKALLSATPVVGGPLTVLLETVFLSPIESRKKEMLIMLSDAVSELQEKIENLDLSEISNNQEFITACMIASQAAIKTHESEKIYALKNALVNSYLSSDIDQTKKLIFLRYIDELTVLHIKLLEFLENPAEFEKRLNTERGILKDYDGMVGIWNEIHPEIPVESELHRQLVAELNARGLTTSNKFKGGKQKLLSKFGDEFLSFIRCE